MSIVEIDLAENLIRPAPTSLNVRQDWIDLAYVLLPPYLRITDLGLLGQDEEMSTSGASPFARWFEGFVRPMTLGASLLAGCSGNVSIRLKRGHHVDLGEWYRTHITNGVNPEHPAAWSRINRPMDQPIVETSILSYCLNIAKPYLWDPLSAETKSQLAAWMQHTCSQFTLNINNWNLFPIMIQLGLSKLEMPYSIDIANNLLTEVERFYHDGGWYADGFYRQFDYYVPEAVYLLLFAAEWIDDGGKLRQKIHERAADFAKDFELFFDSEGRSIFFGRSRAYRFSASFFWAACAWANVRHVDLGLCRRMVSRNIGWFIKQKVFSADGRLNIGYAYPNERVAESYIAQGSPAWAFQSFLPLALPANHRFWTAPEPVELRDTQRHMPGPNLVVTVNSDGSNCTLFNGGSHHPYDFGNHAAKYGKFAYSSHFGINLQDHIYSSCDNMISLSADQGGTWSHRLRFEIGPNENGWLVSRHQPFEWDASTTIKTAMSVRGDWHVRVHLLQLTRPFSAREGGFPVCPQKDQKTGEPHIAFCENGIVLTGENGRVGGWSLIGNLRASSTTAQANVNVLHRRVHVPLLTTDLPAGSHVIATAWYASVDADAVTMLIPPLASVDAEGVCQIAWPDGQRDELRSLSNVDGPLKLITGGGYPWSMKPKA